jgi:hypothetical protein
MQVIAHAAGRRTEPGIGPRNGKGEQYPRRALKTMRRLPLIIQRMDLDARTLRIILQPSKETRLRTLRVQPVPRIDQRRTRDRQDAPNVPRLPERTRTGGCTRPVTGRAPRSPYNCVSGLISDVRVMHVAVVRHGRAMPPGLAARPGRDRRAVRVPETPAAAQVTLFTRRVHLFTRRRHQDRDKPDRKCRRRVKSRDHGRPARPRMAGPARRRRGIADAC